MSEPPPDHRAHDLVGLLTRAERLSTRRLRAVLSETGCSVDAWRVMSLLADGEGHGMTAIAECVLLPPPTLTRLVDQLVDDGVVHRRVDPVDRRRILAYLTPRGVEFWRHLDERVRASWESLPVGGGDDELLGALLRRLITGLEGAPAEPAQSRAGWAAG
ncbi:MarR family winged helix-turn-helix transcriptional regulator [Streptomyces sp. NBC_01803]|uniref:MarR family winged helix-turn-helix transcriptional regulator n=1 Tax=Streptomyces sp. NBC_01803 TaxID=2975946 RepID=UPI002DDBB3C0|nr:MarR family winged helix-turn-helix transcriptional regulator [Streptomyces sp. NBC_01803]WSA46944.1 MarR family winged helix-turn-helix transcriptional regulator [Streptomyces sp. NBC_01803]